MKLTQQEKQSIEKAKTILAQIKATAGWAMIASWGAHGFLLVREDMISLPEKYEAALVFKVNGYLHKGHVIVSLNWNDTYTVSIGKLRAGKFTVKDSVPMVYFDNLGSVIDGLVESDEIAKYEEK